MNIYAFDNFGYDGNVVTVESDIRKGVPAFDIVGLADEATKSSRERVWAGIKNSGLEFPSERILVSLTSGNTHKEGAGYDLPIAMAILNSQMQEKNPETKTDDDRVLVLGELKLSGEITPVRSAVAAAETASSLGISKVICHSGNAEELTSIPGLKIAAVENIAQALEAMQDKEKFVENRIEKKDPMAVEFNVADKELLETARNLDVKGLYQSCHALEVAIAGKHNLYFTGSYSPEKSELIQAFVPTLTPKMTDEEARVTSRIKSIAGLNHGFSVREKNAIPFRIPHQTATLKGMSGGRNAMPGEISLANNGVLFLDDVDEFSISTLHMLRVPIDTKSVTLSKGALSTTYPAKFQLMMAGNSCACGNFGSSSKICMCSVASVKNHTDKIPSSLMVNIEIKDFVERNPKDKRIWNFDDAQKRIKKAYEIQRKRGTFNADLSPDEIREYCKLDEKSEKFFEDAVKTEEFSMRESMNFLKVSLTLANLDGREKIMLKDIKDAYRLTIPVLDSSYTLKLDKKSSLENEKPSLEIEKGR